MGENNQYIVILYSEGKPTKWWISQKQIKKNEYGGINIYTGKTEISVIGSIVVIPFDGNLEEIKAEYNLF